MAIRGDGSTGMDITTRRPEGVVPEVQLADIDRHRNDEFNLRIPPWQGGKVGDVRIWCFIIRGTSNAPRPPASTFPGWTSRAYRRIFTGDIVDTDVHYMEVYSRRLTSDGDPAHNFSLAPGPGYVWIRDSWLTGEMRMRRAEHPDALDWHEFEQGGGNPTQRQTNPSGGFAVEYAGRHICGVIARDENQSGVDEIVVPDGYSGDVRTASNDGMGLFYTTDPVMPGTYNSPPIETSSLDRGLTFSVFIPGRPIIAKSRSNVLMPASTVGGHPEAPRIVSAGRASTRHGTARPVEGIRSDAAGSARIDATHSVAAGARLDAGGVVSQDLAVARFDATTPVDQTVATRASGRHDGVEGVRIDARIAETCRVETARAGAAGISAVGSSAARPNGGRIAGAVASGVAAGRATAHRTARMQPVDLDAAGAVALDAIQAFSVAASLRSLGNALPTARSRRTDAVRVRGTGRTSTSARKAAAAVAALPATGRFDEVGRRNTLLRPLAFEARGVLPLDAYQAFFASAAFRALGSATAPARSRRAATARMRTANSLRTPATKAADDAAALAAAGRFATVDHRDTPTALHMAATGEATPETAYDRRPRQTIEAAARAIFARTGTHSTSLSVLVVAATEEFTFQPFFTGHEPQARGSIRQRSATGRAAGVRIAQAVETGLVHIPNPIITARLSGVPSAAVPLVVTDRLPRVVVTAHADLRAAPRQLFEHFGEPQALGSIRTAVLNQRFTRASVAGVSFASAAAGRSVIFSDGIVALAWSDGHLVYAGNVPPEFVEDLEGAVFHTVTWLAE